MRRGLALLWTLTLMSSVVGVFGAPAASAYETEANRVPVLRRTTTFTASTTSRFLMNIPRDIRVDRLRTNFSGNGRVSGYVIAELGEPVGSGQMLDGYAIGTCDSPGCRPEKDPFRFHFRWNLGKYLEAGTYQVFVIADDAPVTVRLNTRELAGKASYRGGEPIRTEVVTLPVGVASLAQSNVFSAGDFVSWEDGTPEFGLFGMWVYTDSHAATAFGDCAYSEGNVTRPPANELNGAAFMPGCPTGDGFQFHRVSDEPGGYSGEVLVTARWGKPVGLGGWYSTASQVAARGAVGIWIDYED